MKPDTGIAEVEVSAYDIPTPVPESDGAAEWKSTGLVVVELSAADKKGLGYTYTDPGAARLVKDVLAEAVRGIDPFDTAAVHGAMVRAVRNHGRGGMAGMAISAVDCARRVCRLRIDRISWGIRADGSRRITRKRSLRI